LVVRFFLAGGPYTYITVYNTPPFRLYSPVIFMDTHPAVA
jgi:hypothetical protein